MNLESDPFGKRRGAFLLTRDQLCHSPARLDPADEPAENNPDANGSHRVIASIPSVDRDRPFLQDH
jgi:hypothetical protein